MPRPGRAMTAAPRVSIVLPTYNAAGYLPATLDAALAQSFDDFELIVLDNASTDGTAELLATYDDPRLLYSRNAENVGFAGNVNLGLARLRGTYAAILNADDIWERDFLARTVAFLDQHPTASFVHTAAVWIDEDGRPFGDGGATWDELSPGATAFDKCFSDGFCFASMLIRSAALSAVGPLPMTEPWTRIADTWLFLKLCLQGDVGFLRDALVRYRVHLESVSIEMYVDGSFFRRHLAGVRDAYAWPEAERLGLSAGRRRAIGHVARESITILPIARTKATRGRFLRTFAAIVAEAPRIVTQSNTWLRLAYGMLPARTIETIRAARRRRWLSCRRKADA